MLGSEKAEEVTGEVTELGAETVFEAGSDDECKGMESETVLGMDAVSGV